MNRRQMADSSTLYVSDEQAVHSYEGQDNSPQDQRITTVIDAAIPLGTKRASKASPWAEHLLERWWVAVKC